MKKFIDFLTEQDDKKNTKPTKPASPATMRAWVYRQIENTEKTHDQIRREFIAKFGSQNSKLFNQYVSDMVD